MNVLCMFTGGHGHFLPVAQIARAMPDAGHHVTVLCETRDLAAVRREGFAVIELTRDEPVMVAETAPTPPLEEADAMSVFYQVFCEAAPSWRVPALLERCAMIPDLPDVAIVDEVDYGAMIACEILNVPYVAAAIFAAGPFTVGDAFATDLLATTRRPLGLPTMPTRDLVHRYLTVTAFPPSVCRTGLRADTPGEHRFVRPVTPEPRTPAPAWLA